MSFWNLLLRFVPKYKWNIVWYIGFNILSSIFCIFSFATIIPLIQIIFGLTDPNIQYIDYTNIVSLSSAIDVLKNNTLFALQNQIEVNGAVTGLLWVGGFLVLASLLANLSSYFAYYVRIPIRTGISRDLRKDVYGKITYLPLSEMQNIRKGDYISRMTSDVEEVDYGIGTALDMIIRDPIQIIIYVITMFGISWMLSIEALILLTICCSLMLAISLFMKRIAMKGQVQRGRILSAFEETISHLSIIKSFNLEERLNSQFEPVNNEARAIFNKSNRIYSIAFPLTEFLIIVTIAIMLWKGGRYVLDGTSPIDASDFIYFLMIFYSTIPPMRDMIKATFGIRKAKASVERLNKILSVQIECNNLHAVHLDSDIQHIQEGQKLIEFNDVSFSYDNCHEIIQHFNLVINKGEKIAITGNIGKGKTTIASLLLAYYYNYSGKISVARQDIRQLNFQDLRDCIAHIAQEPLLFNDTIRNNITLGNSRSNQQDEIAAAHSAQLDSLLTALPHGIDTQIGDNGNLLSGGQKQCITIARAIYKDSPICILDEATSSLDELTRGQVIQELLSIWSKKTLIIITHDKELLSIADRIITL